MKTFQKQSGFSILVLASTLALLSGCGGGSFGGSGGQQAVQTTNTNTGSQQNSGNFVIKSFVKASNSTLAIRVQKDASALSFINNVYSAYFSFLSSTQLQLTLIDNSGNVITIPTSFAASSAFLNTDDYVLIQLSDGVNSTSVVIDKASSLVFVSNNTDIEEILLSSTPNRTTATFEESSRSVLEVQAIKTDGTNVNIGLVTLNNQIYALKL